MKSNRVQCAGDSFGLGCSLPCYAIALLGGLAVSICAMVGCEPCCVADQATIDAELCVAMCSLPGPAAEEEANPVVVPETGDSRDVRECDNPLCACVDCQCDPCRCNAGGSPPPIDWCSSIEEARERSRADGKPVWIHWSSDGCGPCLRMEREVFPAGEVRELARRVHAVRINVTRHPAIGARWHVRPVPADFIVRPDWKSSLRRSGYRERREWLGWMRANVARSEEVSVLTRGWRPR